MKLYNNTPMEAYYEVSYGNAFECGNIAAQATLDSPQWDKQPSLKVALNAVGSNTPPDESTPFSVTIPHTGTGMAVTIGLYQE